MTQASSSELKIRIHYVLQDPSRMLEDDIFRQLNAQLATGFPGVELKGLNPREILSDPGDITLIDGDLPGRSSLCEKLPRHNTWVAIALRERDSMPEEWQRAKVDDLWVYPFRTLEIAQKLRQWFWTQEQRKVHRSTAELEQTVHRLTEDLEFAALLKDQHRPKKFADYKGIGVISRYFAGVQAGGDYFDVLESADSQNLLLWMTDATSYGLSSAVVSTLSAMGAQLVAAQSVQGLGWVRSFCLKLGPQLARKGSLAGFWGVLSRKDLTLRYLSFGGMGAFRVRASGEVEALEGGQGFLTATQSWSAEWQEKSLRFSPGERLILVSDGFMNAVGGQSGMVRLLESAPEPLRGTVDLEGTGLSERTKLEDGWIDALEVAVKGSLPAPDELPPQDCSWVSLSFDSKLLRLA